MTATECLSARIAALEHQALQAPGLEQEAESLGRQIEALRGHLQARREAIQESHAAARILAHLAEQMGRVLVRGELLLNSNSESIQAELGKDADPSALTDLPDTSELTGSTAETESGDQGQTGINSAVMPLTLPTGPELPPGLDADTPAEHDEGTTQLTQEERVSLWVQTLDHATVITERSAGEALDIQPRSAGGSLARLLKAGALERLPGTGKPGVPSQYRRLGAPEPASSAPNSAQPPTSLAPAELSAPTRPSPSTAALVPVTVPVDPPTPTDPLPEIPARLSTDEASLFDCLRKTPQGLAQRVLQSRLNWSTGRLDKAVQALLKAGHLGRNGDRLVVVHTELASARAV